MEQERKGLMRTFIDHIDLYDERGSKKTIAAVGHNAASFRTNIKSVLGQCHAVNEMNQPYLSMDMRGMGCVPIKKPW